MTLVYKRGFCCCMYVVVAILYALVTAKHQRSMGIASYSLQYTIFNTYYIHTKAGNVLKEQACS